MTPIQKVIKEARLVKICCTVEVEGKERYQIALKDGAYESLRRLARAVNDLDHKECKEEHDGIR
jgi:hypothetical protein